MVACFKEDFRYICRSSIVWFSMTKTLIFKLHFFWNQLQMRDKFSTAVDSYLEVYRWYCSDPKCRPFSERLSCRIGSCRGTGGGCPGLWAPTSPADRRTWGGSQSPGREWTDWGVQMCRTWRPCGQTRLLHSEATLPIDWYWKYGSCRECFVCISYTFLNTNSLFSTFRLAQFCNTLRSFSTHCFVVGRMRCPCRCSCADGWYTVFGWHTISQSHRKCPDPQGELEDKLMTSSRWRVARETTRQNSYWHQQIEENTFNVV